MWTYSNRRQVSMISHQGSLQDWLFNQNQTLKNSLPKETSLFYQKGALSVKKIHPGSLKTR